MSRLFSLARQVSEYLRNRFQQKYRELDESVERATRGRQSDYGSRRGLPRRLPEIFLGPQHRPPQQPPGDDEQRPGAPPVQPPPAGGRPQSKPLKVPVHRTPPTRPVPRPGGAPPYVPPPGTQPPLRPDYSPAQNLPPGGPVDLGEDEYDDIQLLGRDAGYDEADFVAVMENMRTTPGSSNVWGYFFERESRRSGILYVTFLQQDVNGNKSNEPGPTYAYYDVPVTVANQFQKATATSAGGAVWDYLRVRGTIAAHQYNYRLVHVSGAYVPRKVTPHGWKARAVPALGVGRREYRRNTLAPVRWSSRTDSRRAFFGDPDRGEPDRGEPDRGEPDRGR